MANRNIIYHPKSGDKHSPGTLLGSLCNPNEQAHFLQKLELLATLETSAWHFPWLEHLNSFYQVRQGNYRMYFDLVNNDIIVVHVCRKVARRALQNDLDRALNNLRDYQGK